VAKAAAVPLALVPIPPTTIAMRGQPFLLGGMARGCA
jgi:hypothetical protein